MDIPSSSGQETISFIPQFTSSTSQETISCIPQFTSSTKALTTEGRAGGALVNPSLKEISYIQPDLPHLPRLQSRDRETFEIGVKFFYERATFYPRFTSFFKATGQGWWGPRDGVQSFLGTR